MNRRDFLLKSARAMIPVAGSYLISTNPAIAKAIQQASVEDESQQQETPVYHFEGFNERVQAYIVGRYYVRLKGAFGEQGLEVFQLATRTYAEQRGHRMAQQALADGQPLTIETYHRYGEWVSSDECRRKGEDLQQQVIWDAPYYTFHVTRCPWSIQFRDMGLQEAGIAYCKDLDASIYRGFNPAIAYETRQTLNSAGYCIQCAPGSKVSAEALACPKRPSSLRSFEYHCAHSYWTFRQVISSVFGTKGKSISEEVLGDIRRELGNSFAITLTKYQNTDFDVVTNK